MEVLLSDIDYCDACKWVFLPSFLSIFKQTLTNPTWGKKSCECGQQGCNLHLPGNEKDRLHENHSAGF